MATTFFLSSRMITCCYLLINILAYQPKKPANEFGRNINTKIQVNALEVRPSSTKSNTASSTTTNNINIIPFINTQELNARLNTMPLNEKYTILIEAYAKDIIAGQGANGGDNKNVANKMQLMESIESLYAEMIQQPNLFKSDTTQKSTSALLTSASFFFNTVQLGQSIQLAKAGGNLKAFGLSIGQLTTPMTKSIMSSPLLPDITIPKDDREMEVLYASAVFSMLTIWSSLQVSAIFNSELKPWATLLGLLAVALGTLDVLARKGQGFRVAAAGIDRLILRDPERDAHCDSASFLIGYLLGIPTFCYQPNVAEALRLIQETPDYLQVYKQPKSLQASVTSSGSGTRGGLDNLMNNMFWNTNSNSGSNNNSNNGEDNISSSSPSVSMTLSKLRLEGLSSWQKNRSSHSELLSLGRVLIWLMAPVAAEYLKYGKTNMADPKKPQKFMTVLSTINKERHDKNNGNNGSTSNSMRDIASLVPMNTDDQNMLLKWAFYEATLLVRQYGDIIEELSEYVGVGSASVGECVEVIEQELS